MEKKIVIILVIVAMVLLVIAIGVTLQGVGRDVKVPKTSFSKSSDTSSGKIGVDVIAGTSEDK